MKYVKGTNSQQYFILNHSRYSIKCKIFNFRNNSYGECLISFYVTKMNMKLLGSLMICFYLDCNIWYKY